MNYFKTTFGPIFIFILMISCDEKRIESHKNPNQETPVALQEGNDGIVKYSRENNGDLTELLYQELVEKTPELKKFEEEFEEFNTNSNDMKSSHYQFNNKSNNYYNSAKNKAAAIGDNVLRKKIEAIIGNSSKKYSSKVADLDYLMKQILKKEATLRDHHTILKIVLTLPLIENYQNQNKPDKKTLKQLLNKTDKLILRTDSLTPKF